jgi:hypothetical protein
MKTYVLPILVAALVLPLSLGAKQKPKSCDGMMPHDGPVAVQAHQQRDMPPPHDMMQATRPQDQRLQDLNVQDRANNVQFEHEMKKIELEKQRTELERSKIGVEQARRNVQIQGRHCMCPGGRAGMFLCVLIHAAILAVIALVHLLLAIWVYLDIRKRNAGSGLWIVITLLIGFFGVLPYAIVRMGDIRASQQ